MLSVYAPAAGASLFDDHVTVFGATERGATVFVNGVGVQVNPFDGTFQIDDLTLTLGAGTGCVRPATVTVTATDAAGNTATVVRSVQANRCVTHPVAASAIPAVEVPLGFAGTLAFDLASYFADDGGAENLVFSTYADGASGVTVSSSTGGLTFAWAASAAPGTYPLTVIARDRSGESSDPVAASLVVGPASSNRAPLIRLAAPVAPLPVGAVVNLDLVVTDPDGDEVTSSVDGGAPAFEHAGGALVVASGALAHTDNWVTVRATDEHGAVSSLDVEVPVYDASVDPQPRVVDPADLELTASEAAAAGSFEVGTARYVGGISLAPDGQLTPAIVTSQPLNAEHTLWRVMNLGRIGATPGTYTVGVLVGDTGLAPTRVDFAFTVVPDPVAPTLSRIVAVTGSLDVTAGDSLSLQAVGNIPDPANTEITWTVDGEPAAHGAIFEDVSLSPGTHAVTATAAGPGGSTSTGTTITVSPRAATLPGRSSNAWMWAVGLGGLVVVGIILGGTEIGIYFLLAGVIGAVIDRQAREKLLTHFVRGRIYQIIEFEPGIHLSELQRKAGVARGVCAYHLHALEKAGLIKTTREGMYLRFFATKVKIDAELYTLAADDKAVLEAIEAQPGITEQQVAALLGKSNLHVTRCVRTLSQSGYVEMRREGEELQLFARTGRGQSSTAP